MPDASHIRSVLERYPELLTSGNHEAIVALYHEAATIEDPVGAEPLKGRAAISEFYKASAGTVTMKITGPVRVAGHEAAAPLRVLIGPEGPGRQALDVIDVMSFDDDGLITSMRAFWGPDSMRPATADD